MKKQLFPLFLCLLTLPMGACNGGGTSTDPREDATKVNIKVGTINLGFGKDWLHEVTWKW